MIINDQVEKPDDATLILRRTLNAPRERAFRAWTSAESIKQWMRPEPDTTVPFASMDLRVGGKFRIQMRMSDGEFFTAAGEFREVKAPEKLVYTWDWEKDGSGEAFGELEGNTSLITVEFIARGQKTDLIFTHSRFVSVAKRDSHAKGWPKLVGNFIALAEKE
jgi:uncharacterized protein YndB with AHSA1/START domain